MTRWSVMAAVVAGCGEEPATSRPPCPPVGVLDGWSSTRKPPAIAPDLRLPRLALEQRARSWPSLRTVEELRVALVEWRALYNERWIVEKHGYLTADSGPARARCYAEGGLNTVTPVSRKSGGATFAAWAADHREDERSRRQTMDSRVRRQMAPVYM